VWRRAIVRPKPPRRPQVKHSARDGKPGKPQSQRRATNGSKGKPHGRPPAKPKEKQPDPLSPFAGLKALLRTD